MKGRISVCEELDRRGIDIDSVLCPSCNNAVETCAYALVTCDLAMSVWDKIFTWWKVGTVNAFSIDEFSSSYGNVNVPTYMVHLFLVLVRIPAYQQLCVLFASVKSAVSV
ncbi:RNA-directed DNA polymerase, eukaryota, reverse transcriptase zinc-binding domain protein, partial [Tanacetum coccineum]